MAKSRAANYRNSTRKAAQKEPNAQWKFPLEKTNWVWIGIAGGVILLGYILLGLSITEEAATVDGTWNNFISVSVAPVVLVIGYCILLPYGILKGTKFKSDKYTTAEERAELNSETPATADASVS